ncbi:bifunctional 3-deoxy-7-phosphoheptulonate synthase/chorismate mutase type II [Lepagella muris]|jgi:chorismate mutase|uniref:3-deoxy-7-phosphoheptulonate synthase n=1 Tax=Lepagella muris TaxID=3032870 RepID=A0AC61RAW2_9BACT|nr:bifunctional 3-deoxy-7-phosphoheptulonate synthase/chorismate mutase type II [Lepagella muris]ROT09187.1 3-deoxy-7-phosphoheptulonate synthase [Muribaculaceae bacterium Isolate-037 (Harlan)]TGY76662.1 3-deoxy-7-phosphoheptulonate synthase [Lepagella muris]THG48212.1 3-deoxy-7-phosphoheptulonate synthase [Bacteroidales bacterium]TKC54366.1 3-deoxy-7-phosphoheptulonate synthase [Bacteroidales bacterium]
MNFEDLKPIVEGLDPSKPLVMAGPCSAETEEQTLSTARQLAMGGIKIFRAGIWKPRTKPGGFEGIGKEGLAWLQRVREETGMLVATEVAMRAHVLDALEAGVDILWVGARTSANPFAVQEIADTLKEAGATDVAVLVKNPVNPDLELWIGALERLYNAGIRRLGAIHRGFSFYGKSIYRNPPQWHIPIELHRRIPHLPIVIDPSHMGGKRELISSLSQQALDMKFAGLMIESHCSPDDAWSDKNQQVTPEVLKVILGSLVHRNTVQETESLQNLRDKIDRIDTELVEMYKKRMDIAREIGKYKKEHSMPVVQETRYNDLIKSRVAAAVEMGMSADFMKTILQAIHEESVRQQIEVLNQN